MFGMVGQEGVHAGERIAHRVESRDEHEVADIDHIVARQSLTVDLGHDEPRHHVVGRSPHPLIGEGAKVFVDLLAGLGHDRRPLLGIEERVRVDLLGVQDPVADAQEHPELFFGKTHQSEEHRAREDLGKLFGEVAFPSIDESVDQGIDPPGDVRLLFVHALRGEQRIEQPAVLRVQRRIDVERDQRPYVAQPISTREEKSSWWRSTCSVNARSKVSTSPSAG